ncbi:MAG: hypothetical protein WB711_11175, partial [Terriglobales bacterium]
MSGKIREPVDPGKSGSYQSMHYERAPGLSGWDGWRRLRSATLCGASLRSGGERVGVRGKEV